MATITVDVPLDLTHGPDDRLRLRVGSGDGLSLAESTPAGGIVLVEEAIGALADDDPAATRTLSASHRPPGSDAVLAIGVEVVDAAGNVSAVYETFERVSDHPRGSDTLPVAATDNDNEALVSWSPTPDFAAFEGASA